LSDAEIQGRALAQEILEQKPANNYTNTGTLEIRGETGQRTELPVICQTIVSETNWQSRYEAKPGPAATAVTTLVVTHSGSEPNHYLVFENGEKIRVGGSLSIQGGRGVSGDGTMVPFAGSDFWLGDLGLEFFHWPQQKVLKKEFHRQCACAVLESTNPNPSAHSYSRVVSWIDNDSLGIVEAYAYDANGKKLKNFYPKNLEKVNGQYQVESMVMENLQTGSRSVFEFDFNK